MLEHSLGFARAPPAERRRAFWNLLWARLAVRYSAAHPPIHPEVSVAGLERSRGQVPNVSRPSIRSRDSSPMRSRRAWAISSARGARALTGVAIRFADFETVRRQIKLAQPTASAKVIEAAVHRCFGRVPLRKKVRPVGVRLGALMHPRRPRTSPPAKKAAGRRPQADPNQCAKPLDRAS